jgi:hypothetical protein
MKKRHLLTALVALSLAATACVVHDREVVRDDHEHDHDHDRPVERERVDVNVRP